MEENKEIIEKLHARLSELREFIKKITIQIEATENAIIGFGGVVETSEESTDVIIYSKDLTIKKKILYALGELKKATAEQLADYINGKDNTIDEDKIKKTGSTITMVSSSMYTHGELDRTKDGKKNVYYLK